MASDKVVLNGTVSVTDEVSDANDEGHMSDAIL